MRYFNKTSFVTMRTLLGLFSAGLLAFCAIDVKRGERDAKPVHMPQSSDMVHMDRTLTTFTQFDCVVRSHHTVSIYARFTTSIEEDTFEPFNFSANYAVDLSWNAELIRSYSVLDKKVELGRNGTKFVRVLQASNIELDIIIVKVECRRLRQHSPRSEIHVFVDSNRVELQKRLYHSVFLFVSVAAFGLFVVMWRHSLDHGHLPLMLLIGSIVSHQRLMYFRNPELSSAIVLRLERTLIKIVCVAVPESAGVIIVLTFVEFVFGVKGDLLYDMDEDLESTRFYYLAACLCIMEMIYVIAFNVKRLGNMKILRVCGFLSLIINEGVLTFMPSDLPGWCVLTMVIPDLCVILFVGITLDLMSSTTRKAEIDPLY